MNDERAPGPFSFSFFFLLVAGWAALLLLIIGLTGCARSSSTTGWANVAQAAAFVGTQEYLKDHPEHRQAFELTAAALNVLIRNGVTNPDAFSELILSLPINSLNSPTGSVYLSEHPVIWNGKRAIVGTSEPVRKAILTGLKGGMLPAPPLPPASSDNLVRARGRSVITARFVPEVFAEFVALVPFAIEIVTNAPPSLNLLSVTFPVYATNALYGLDARPNKDSAWVRQVTLDNLAAGETTWAVSWPHNKLPGIWRVTRLKR